MGQQQEQQEQLAEEKQFQLASYNDIEGPKQRRPKRRSSYVSQARRWVQVDRRKGTQSMNPPTSSTSLQSSVNETSMINHHALLTTSITTQSRGVEEKEDGGGCGVCVICMDDASNEEAVCVPCGHVAGCVSCLKKIQDKNFGCPVCRANIDQVIKLYHV